MSTFLSHTVGVSLVKPRTKFYETPPTPFDGYERAAARADEMRE